MKYAENYVEKALAPNERLYILLLNGHTMEPGRKAMVQKMHAAFWKNQSLPEGSRREPWDMFKIFLEPDPENEYDPHAVKVMVASKSGDTLRTTHLGFVKATERGKPTGVNRAVCRWISRGEVLRLVALDIGEKEQPWLVMGLVTSEGTTALPKNCNPIPSFTKKGRTGPAPAHAGEIPVASTRIYPSSAEIDELISLHREFERYFGWEEVDGGETYYIAPVFLSQWAIDPQSFMNDASFASFIESKKERDLYGTLEETVDLREIEEKYGPVMATHYFKFSGVFAGPFTAPHVREVISVMSQVLTTIRESPMIQVRED